MLQKNLPLYAPHFKSIVFCLKKIWLCEFFLSSDLKFIVGLNNFYDKFNRKDMLSFNKFFLKSYSIHWMRVSFRGKGYRLRKFRRYNKVTLNFGHSHWARIALQTESFFFKKLRRQNYLCLAKTYQFYKSIKDGFKLFKKLNMYTKRGLRLKKQFIKRRFGKVSQVVSSLH